MRARLAVLALPLLGGCSAAGDPYAPREGLWEVKTSFVTAEGPDMTAARVSELRKAFPRPAVDRECFDGKAARVGDVKPDGCKVTRFADAGNKVDREWQCPAKGRQGIVTSTFTGARGPEHYDFRIATSATLKHDRKPTVVTMREQGRRIGDCHAKS